VSIQPGQAQKGDSEQERIRPCQNGEDVAHPQEAREHQARGALFQSGRDEPKECIQDDGQGDDHARDGIHL